MSYIENVYFCMIIPILVAMIFLEKKHRSVFLFLVIGMTTCICSAYVNTFFAGVCRADNLSATVEIAPVCEEILKIIPLIFYLMIFEPQKKEAKAVMISISTGFAIMENTYFMTMHETKHLLLLLIRGLGTGVMHIICGAIVGYGLIFIWDKQWIKIAGTSGLLCTVICIHAIFNLMVSI